MIVVLVIAAVVALIVVSSVVGARRNRDQIGVADDPVVERARGEAYVEHQRHHHGGGFGH